MTDPLTNNMAEMAINMKHWKDIKFNENFLAETRGRGVSEYIYVRCAGTYGTHEDGRDCEHASEKSY